jgi:hypothetical protein
MGLDSHATIHKCEGHNRLIHHQWRALHNSHNHHLVEIRVLIKIQQEVVQHHQETPCHSGDQAEQLMVNPTAGRVTG